MPCSISPEEEQQALEAFNEALRNQWTQTGSTPVLPKELFRWKEFRSSTKSLLLAVGNCLQQALPAGWSFSSCKPPKLLVPRSLQTDRLKLLPMEVNYLDLKNIPKDANLHYIHHYGTNERWLDFNDDDSYYKLVFSADEGTEVPQLLVT